MLNPAALAPRVVVAPLSAAAARCSLPPLAAAVLRRRYGQHLNHHPAHVSSSPAAAREQPDAAPLPVFRSGHAATHKIKLAALDDSRPVASVAILLPCGSRHEDLARKEVGASRLFSDSLFVAKKLITSEYLVCEPLTRGVIVKCKSTRDNLIYSATMPRDQVPFFLKYIYQSVSDDVFEHFRLEKASDLLSLRRAAYWENPSNVALENAYALAFKKSAFGNFSTGHPDLPVLAFSSVRSFITRNAVFDSRASIAAVGVSYDELNESVSNMFDGIGEGDRADSKKSSSPPTAKTPKYYGGSTRVPCVADSNVLLFAGPGARFADLDSRAAFEVLACLVAPKKAVNHHSDEIAFLDAQSNASHIAHSDTGLFVLRVKSSYGEPKMAAKEAKRAIMKLRDAAAGKIDADALNSAKRRAFIRHCTKYEPRDARAIEIAHSQAYSSEGSVHEKFLQVSASAVAAAAKKLVASTPTFVAVGNTMLLPHVDDFFSSD